MPTHDVALGASFDGSSTKRIHTLRYNFKPEKADLKRTGNLQLRGASVKLSVPSTSGGQILLVGNSEPHKEVECALTCDAMGNWRVEKLEKNIKNLKQERSAAGEVRGSGGEHAAAAQRTSSAAPPVEEEHVAESDLFGDDGDDDNESTPSAGMQLQGLSASSAHVEDSLSDSLSDSDA